MKKFLTLTLLVIAGAIAYAVFTAQTQTPADVRLHNALITSQNLNNNTEDSTATSSESKTQNSPAEILIPDTKIHHKAPFISQAPELQWDNQTFQDACEEASLLMAMRWLHNQKAPTAQEATKLIQELADFEQNNYGFHLDIGIPDLERTTHDFYKHTATSIINNPTVDDIRRALHEGSVVIATMNGKALNNPYFSNGGPDRHALLIIGHDPKKKEFITNDPGTRRGENFRYSEQTIIDAIRDYPSGYHQPFPDPIQKNILIISKN